MSKALASMFNQRRVALGLTKQQVQKNAGVGPSQSTAIFAGEWVGLRWATILKVADALDLDFDQIIAGLPCPAPANRVNKSRPRRVPSYKLAQAMTDELRAVLGGSIEVRSPWGPLSQTVEDSVRLDTTFEHWDLTFPQALDIILGGTLPPGQKDI